MLDVTLEQAQAPLAAASAKATELGVAMNIAVVNTNANLIVFARMDGAQVGSVAIAQRKARQALFHPDGPLLYQVEISNRGLITSPSGVPLRNDAGVIIGAIGVSGPSVETDHLIAQAGATVI